MDDPETRFTTLYDTYYRRVLGYALIHAERGAAEDIASETFLIAWRRFEHVPEQPLPWLLTVARNLVHKQYDKRRRRRALTDRIAALTTAEDLLAWDIAEHVVERDAALAAIGTLSERDLEILALVTWHGLDPRAAAKVVGCSAAAFFVRLHRARKRLVSALDAAPLPSAVKEKTR